MPTRKILFIFYYILLGASVGLALLWLFDKTQLIGLEKGAGLQYTIMGMALAGIVMGQVLRRPGGEALPPE